MEWQIVSDKSKSIAPNKIQAKKCICCFDVLKIMRDKMGTASPTKAMGPQ